MSNSLNSSLCELVEVARATRNDATGIQEYRNSDVVRVQGFEFTVTELHIQRQERPILAFVGVCTDNPVNDSIRHTGYNGGTYSLGWLA